MKRSQIIFLFLLISLLSSTSNFATVFNAVATGDWSNSGTWDQGSVPTASDTVNIDGYIVTISSSDVTVKRISITNASNSNTSQLIIDGSVTVTITDDLIATAERYAYDVDLQIKSTAVLNVNGNVNFSRASDNNKVEMLRLYIYDSGRMNVSGDFTFDYQNSAPGEATREVRMENNSILDVTGNVNLYSRGGNNFDFYSNGGPQILIGANLLMDMSGGKKFTFFVNGGTQFQLTGNATINNSGGANYALLNFNNSSGSSTISGNVALNSTASNKTVELEISGNSVPVISGDITMSAIGDGDVLLDLRGNSDLKLGGNLIRTDYGTLAMQNPSYLTFNGSVAQYIPEENLAGSGNDNFGYTNIGINNTSGSPVTLKSDITVNVDFKLTNGILKTTDTTSLIIADGATITGGSETAYVDGPIIKQGTTNDLPFVFPTGEGSSYGPIEISKVTTSSSQYTAQYLSCPPPFGNHLATGVAQVSPNEYWTLSRTAGSDAVNVTLHWMDAAASGITDTDSLIVSYYDETLGWINAGNGGVTGGVGEGVSGSISNLASCPPPFGSEKFTFGTVSELTPLPVELTRFTAHQDGFDILLEWETSTESNSSHFIVEKSEDGKNFVELISLQAQGFSTEPSYYRAKDIKPEADKNYYRLQQVDFDGMNEYSEIVVVNFESSENKLLLFPNPVRDYIQISSHDNTNIDTSVDIFDQNGQLLYSGVTTMINGKIRIPTNQVNLPATGNYFVVLQNEKGTQSLQFVKIN